MDERETSTSTLLRTLWPLAALFVVATAGYKLIGGPQTSWIDALYMTVITLSTVGYGETIDLSHSPGGRAFTILVILTGVGTLVYFVSRLIAFLVEGHLEHMLRRRRMKRKIDQLSGHTVLCGGGHTGVAVLEELLRTERPVVLIEASSERYDELVRDVGRDLLAVIGDATDDDTLEAAGVKQASGLVTAVSNDKDNLIVTISARLLNPKLRIVARCIDPSMADKMAKAGADKVVSPNSIGGLRMVSELVRPAAVSFLDTMLRDRASRVRVEAVPVPAGSPFDGVAFGELAKRVARSSVVVALEGRDGEWVHNPTPDHALEAGMALVLIASPDGRRHVEQVLRPLSE